MADNLRIGIQVDNGQANNALKQTQQQLAATAMAANKADSSMVNLGRGAAQANTSLINLGRVVQDAPFGFIGIANNIDPLLGSFQSLRKETGSVGGAFKACMLTISGTRTNLCKGGLRCCRSARSGPVLAMSTCPRASPRTRWSTTAARASGADAGPAPKPRSSV